MSFLFRPDMSYENIISESNMRTPRQQMKLWLSFIDCGYIFFFLCFCGGVLAGANLLCKCVVGIRV